MTALLDAYEDLRALRDGRHRLAPRLVVERAFANVATALALA